MSATQPPTVQNRRRGRKLPKLPLLLVLLACCAASGDVSQPRPQGFGIGDYEYLYDELPREHLRRSSRAAAEAADASRQAVEAYQQAAEALKQSVESPKQSAVQHVPAHAPRAPEATGAGTAIQRVPRVEAGGAEVHSAAAPSPGQAQAPAPAPPEPRARVQGPAEVVPAQQAPEVVPAAVPDAKYVVTVGNMTPVPETPVGLAKTSEEPKEDMETSNFFWGLGPVYPHLYVYRRVPHLVPLHGWSPYHAYYITHPSSR